MQLYKRYGGKKRFSDFSFQILEIIYDWAAGIVGTSSSAEESGDGA